MIIEFALENAYQGLISKIKLQIYDGSNNYTITKNNV